MIMQKKTTKKTANKFLLLLFSPYSPLPPPAPKWNVFITTSEDRCNQNWNGLLTHSLSLLFLSHTGPIPILQPLPLEYILQLFLDTLHPVQKIK